MIFCKSNTKPSIKHLLALTVKNTTSQNCIEITIELLTWQPAKYYLFQFPPISTSMIELKIVHIYISVLPHLPNIM